MEELNNNAVDPQEIPNEVLEGVAGGAGPDKNGNYICPWCREYALKPKGDGSYHCDSCGKDFDHHF